MLRKFNLVYFTCDLFTSFDGCWIWGAQDCIQKFTSSFCELCSFTSSTVWHSHINIAHLMLPRYWHVHDDVQGQSGLKYVVEVEILFILKICATQTHANLFISVEYSMSVLDELKTGITDLVEQYKESQIPMQETSSVARVCFVVEKILHMGLKGTYFYCFFFYYSRPSCHSTSKLA